MRIIKGSHRGFTLPDNFVPSGSELLNLQHNNSLIDTSPNPKTVWGAVTYTDGLYGEPLSAGVYTNGRIIGTNETLGSHETYSISVFCKLSGDCQLKLGSGATANVFPGVNLYNIQSSGGLQIRGYSNAFSATVTYHAYQDGYKNGDWLYIVFTVDNINKVVKLYVNCEDVTNKTSSSNTDPSLITPFPDAKFRTYNIAATSFVYFSVMRDYVMSAEEMKAEYKKYPKI